MTFVGNFDDSMSDTVKIKPIYRDGLDPSDKVRYENKLAIVGGVDPYECKEQWSEDVGILPSVTYPDIVNYLIFTPSRFKIDDLKAWKSLEAVNQLCSGWVRDRVAISKGQHVIVKTKVRTCTCGTSKWAQLKYVLFQK